MATQKKFKVLFESPNGDDPLEPDCIICAHIETCKHKNSNPCTFDILENQYNDVMAQYAKAIISISFFLRTMFI